MDAGATVVIHPISLRVPVAAREFLAYIVPVGLLFFIQKGLNYWADSRGLRKGSKDNPRNALSRKLGKSKARFLENADTGVKFQDVGGLSRILQEMQEIVGTMKGESR